MYRQPNRRPNKYHQQQQQRHKQKQQDQRPWDPCANTDHHAIDPSDSSTSSNAATEATSNAQPHLNLTVMSYNVLAQHLINVHPALYAQHQPRHLDWPHRFERILAAVRLAKPDILCLQEVQLCHLGDFIRALRDCAHLDGHLYQKRTHATYRDGCAIFYRSDCVQLVRSHTVEFLQPQTAGVGGGVLLDRPNVAVLAHFHAAHNSSIELVVATTHLLYNPRREDVRLAQTQLLLAELDRCAYLGRCPDSGAAVHAPVVLTGDFNAEPRSATVQLLTHGAVRYAGRFGTRLEEQEDGTQHTGQFGRCLLPLQLGVTDECQHGVVAEATKCGRRGEHVADMSATWVSVCVF